MRFRRLSAALCGALVLLGCVGCRARGPRVLRLAVPAPAVKGFESVADEWAELTVQRTNGRLIIETFPAPADARGQLEAVRQGASTDCALIPAPVVAEEDAAFNVFALPWLFPDGDTAGRVCEGPVGEAMLERLDRLGLVGLAYATHGFRQLATNGKAVHTAADLDDLIIRLPSGAGYALHADTLRALGARPTQTQRAYMHAWQPTARDLAESVLPGDMRALTLWNGVWEPFVLVVNKRAWEDLPKLERDLLRMSAQDAAGTQRRLAAETEERLAAVLEEAGATVVRLRLADRAAFEEAAAPAIERWTETIGPDLVAKFRAEVERAR